MAKYPGVKNTRKICFMELAEAQAWLRHANVDPQTEAHIIRMLDEALSSWALHVAVFRGYNATISSPALSSIYNKDGSIKDLSKWLVPENAPKERGGGR